MSFQVSFDLVLGGAFPGEQYTLQDIGITDGCIAAIGRIVAGAVRKVS